jgi:hypothetical protein
MWRPIVLCILLSAGCLGHAPSLTNPLKLEIHNDTSVPAEVRFTVFEAYGNTEVFERAYQLGVGERILVERVDLLEGSYRMRTESQDLSRDADVHLGKNDHYRFVILPDIIAFQRVSP